MLDWSPKQIKTACTLSLLLVALTINNPCLAGTAKMQNPDESEIDKIYQHHPEIDSYLEFKAIVQGERRQPIIERASLLLSKAEEARSAGKAVAACAYYLAASRSLLSQKDSASRAYFCKRCRRKSSKCEKYAKTPALYSCDWT
jgi:hypothetical protein